MNNQPFSAREKKELADTNITMTQLSKRYHLCKARARTRNVPILPIYGFYRQYVEQLKSLADQLGTTPSELLPLVDVHSLNGNYIEFKILLRNEHKKWHSKQYQLKAEEALKTNKLTCRHCAKEKALSDFVKSTSTLSGYVATCKKCSNELRRAKKNLGVA